MVLNRPASRWDAMLASNSLAEAGTSAGFLPKIRNLSTESMNKDDIAGWLAITAHLCSMEAGRLCYFYLLKAEAGEEGRYRGTSILPSDVQDPIFERSFLQLIFGFGASLGLKILIGRNEQAR